MNLVSAEEYLELDRTSDVALEYIYGEVAALTASPSHGYLVGTAATAIGKRLAGGTCRLYSGARLTLVPRAVYAHPDWTAVCGARQWSQHDEELLNPLLVIAVLSPSTRNYDLGDKRRLYCKLPTLRELVLIEQTSIGIKHWHRSAGSRWEVDELEDESATLRLDSLGIELPVAEIYAGIDWTESR